MVNKLKGSFIVVLCSIFLMVLLIGCKGKSDELQETIADDQVKNSESQVENSDLSESSIASDNANDSQSESEQQVEDKTMEPLIRHETASGGMHILSPEGISTSDLKIETIGNLGFVKIDLPGIEYRKSYELSIAGKISKTGEITVYLIDGNQNKTAENTQKENEWVLNLSDGTQESGVLAKQVLTSIDAAVSLTNNIRSTNRGQLVITFPVSLLESVKIESIELKRSVGELMFSDEFDTDGLLNDSAWTYEVGGNGWGNGELQYYTDHRFENAHIENNNLVLTAIEETRNNNDYTSARVRTKEGFLYGRYEIRGTLPYGRGTWPAIWMMPLGNAYGNWPQSGEIDIMEHVGFDMDTIHANLHMGAFNFRKGNNPTGSQIVPFVDTVPHTFVLEWSKYQIDVYIDDVLSLTYTNDGEGPSHWPYDQPFYLIMNIAVGGQWGAQQGIDPIFPQSMKIDYVRFYELKDTVIDYNPPQEVEKIDAVIQGNMVKLSWTSAKDDYLVENYHIQIKKDGDSQWIEKDFTDISGSFTGLTPDASYKGEIVAMDDSGNRSVPTAFEFRTQKVITNKTNEWITLEQRLFNNGGKIVSDQSYIGDFETDNQLGYRFNVPRTGLYQLELEISGRLFDGSLRIEDEDGIVLNELIAKKTGADDVFNVVVSEPFSLEKGEQTLVFTIVKNGFNIKNIRCVEVK